MHMPQIDHRLAEADRSRLRAWVALATIPIFAIAAFALGEGTISLLGYPVGGRNPLWVGLVSDLVVCALLLTPCVTAIVFGLRARRAGARAALIPVFVGVVVGVGTLILTIVTEVGDHT